MSSEAKTRDTKLPIEDPFAAAFVEEDIQGRSLWLDAWHRLLKNRAAVVSGIIMIIMVLMVIFGPMLLPWEGDFTD
jgi:oligopeptide transport system permease protein